MRGWKLTTLAACVVIAGCGGKPPVEYDAVHNQSSHKVELRPIDPKAKGADACGLQLQIKGEGKRPSEWKATLWVSFRGTKLEKLWSKELTVVLFPDEELYAETYKVESYWTEERTFPATFSLPDLVQWIEHGGKMTISGEPLDLRKDEKDKALKAIASVREYSNAS